MSGEVVPVWFLVTIVVALAISWGVLAVVEVHRWRRRRIVDAIAAQWGLKRQLCELDWELQDRIRNHVRRLP